MLHPCCYYLTISSLFYSILLYLVVPEAVPILFCPSLRTSAAPDCVPRFLADVDNPGTKPSCCADAVDMAPALGINKIRWTSGDCLWRRNV